MKTIKYISTGLIAAACLFVLGDVQAQTRVETDARLEAGAEASVAEDEIDYLDTDDDGDGIETARTTPAVGAEASAQAQTRGEVERTENAPETETEEEASSEEASPARGGIDKSTPILYKGVCVSAATDGDNDCDDSDESASPEDFAGRADVVVEVEGEEVREWAQGQRDQALAIALENVSDAGELGLYLAQAALENEAITEVSTSPTESSVEFETQISLFGFIPMTVEAEAEVEASGEVEIDYPWYAFLARKTSQTDQYSALATSIRARHDALLTAQAE